MKLLAAVLIIFSSVLGMAQATGPLTMPVPDIALGENQPFEILSFDAVGPEQFSVLYMQRITASVVGDGEFFDPAGIGSFKKVVQDDLVDFVPYSNQALLLVRQTFGQDGTPNTKFWLIAVRSLESAVGYKMHLPENYVHPIIKNQAPIYHSLKSVDQVPDLTPTEFEALVSMAKAQYGFYEYPQPTSTVRYSTLAESLTNMKSGFKELGAVLGTGKSSLPKGEKVMFKREVIDNIRLAATKVSTKDSVTIKLYISLSSDSEYELLSQKSYAGSCNPLFATALVHDINLQVSGAYGWMSIKPKEKGADNILLLAGIDENGEPHFWEIQSGKNGINSMAPFFSYAHPNGIYVVSLNRDKIFKPYYQHHLLKSDGTTELLYPTTEAEVRSEKSEYVRTEQAPPPAPGTSTAPSTTGINKTDEPVGVFEWHGHRYIFTNKKTVDNNGSTVTTTFGNLSVLHIDDQNKVVESYEILDNRSTEMVYPFLLGEYPEKVYFLVNYPNMFKLIVQESAVTTETLEDNVFELVYQANGDCLSINQHGTLLMVKSKVGNERRLEFFPSN